MIGAGLLATGVLLIRRHPMARWVYALFLLVTLLWAIAEVGLDWWALVPRAALLTLKRDAWADRRRAGNVAKLNPGSCAGAAPICVPA